MKFLSYGKDGGKDSTVHGFWLVEIKGLFSVALLRFSDGTRDAFHSHAFDALSWVLSGELQEEVWDASRTYRPSLLPIFTSRSCIHRVRSRGISWVFTLRGPWLKEWLEFDPVTMMWTLLGHGREALGKWHDSALSHRALLMILGNES